VTDSSPAGTRANTATVYSERLYVTWYWWPMPLLAATLLAAEVHMGYPGVRSWLPYAVMLPLTLFLLFQWGRTRIAVRDGELRINDTVLPLALAGRVDVFAAKDKRKALGPNYDPAAFAVHRGWIGPLVRVEVTDPDDPTPYWLFSTRHPDQVVAALNAAR
jgi:hypothetical protein